MTTTHTTSPTTRSVYLPNGLTIVAEPMPHKQAAAWAFLVPAGAANEPEEREGISTVLEGLCYRGAGERDSRALSDALDNLGIERGGGSGIEYTSFGGATLGDYLEEALALYADIIRRPRLPEDEWEAQRELALQSLQSLEDAPARKMMVHLRRAYFPGPFGRCTLGNENDLKALTLDDLRVDHQNRYRPDGAILALAGKLDFEAIVERVTELFGDWEGSSVPIEDPVPVDEPVSKHIEQSTSQQQIGVVYSGVPSTDAHFYDYRVAISVLSGGMGARLFTEVREKRGLVYSVSASAHSHRGCGFTMAYAGTTPERSQKTLDVLLHELERIDEGVTIAEVERAKTGMLSGLIMQEESSRARASAIARDQFMLGRVRSLGEISAAVQAVTPESIAEFVQKCPPRDFTVVTLGPKELEVRPWQPEFDLDESESETDE